MPVLAVLLALWMQGNRAWLRFFDYLITSHACEEMNVLNGLGQAWFRLIHANQCKLMRRHAPSQQPDVCNCV